MSNQLGFGLLALTALAPFAMANDDDKDLDRVSLPAVQGPQVTFKPGKGVTIDGGDTYSITIYNRLQAQWRFSALDGAAEDVQTVRLRRARTKLKGHAYSKSTRWVLYTEWAAAGAPLDAYIEQDLWSNDEGASVVGRIGAMKTLYGREATGTSGKLEFTERSLAARTFSDVRSLGMLAQLSAMEDKFHAHIGTFNNATAGGSSDVRSNAALNDTNEMNWTVGARYDVKGDMGDTGYGQGDLDMSEEWNFSFGANIWIGQQTAGAGNADVDELAYNVNVAAKGQGFHVLAEYFGHNTDPDTPGSQDADTSGWNIQASKQFDGGFGVAARASMVSIDDAGSLISATSSGATGGGTALVGTGEVTEFTIGVNRFFNGHGRKLQADITFQSVDPDTGSSLDNIIFRLMATLGI